MQLSDTPKATFDDPNLVSSAGLVPMVALAQQAGLRDLADAHLSVPTDKGANAGLKVSSLVSGMVAGADSIDDMAILRHGGMAKMFGAIYAPSTLGSFLRKFTFGHVRQLDAVASRFLRGLAEHTPVVAGIDDYALVDIDDSVVEVHGYAKQGSGYGYSGVRGLNSLITTVTTAQAAPVVLSQRLRKGACNSARGAARIVSETLANLARLRSPKATGTTLFRGDSAFYNHGAIGAAITAGAQVSVTARMDPKVKETIAKINEDAWQKIKYTDAVYDEDTDQWISVAEVAEIPFTAFTSKRKSAQVSGRLVVRRIPAINPKGDPGQQTLFQTWRFHAFFTTSDLDTVTADQTHRRHAIIEQVHADLKASALAHLPSGQFCANAAWLVLAVMAFNLTRAAATASGDQLAKATTPTIRRKLINVPARIASSARRLTLHLPQAWPWQDAWTTLYNQICGPPGAPAPT